MANIFDSITSPLQAVREGAEKLLELKGILDHGDTIRDLHANVILTMKAAIEDQQIKAAMQNEIDRLKREVTDLKANNAKLERYELKSLPPGVLVMSLKQDVQPAEPMHYACENCFNNSKISRLQSGGIHHGLERLRCNGCGAELKTGHFSQPKPVQAARPYNPLARR